MFGREALGKRIHVRFETDLKMGADRVETMAAIEASYFNVIVHLGRAFWLFDAF